MLKKYIAMVDIIERENLAGFYTKILARFYRGEKEVAVKFSGQQDKASFRDMFEHIGKENFYLRFYEYNSHHSDVILDEQLADPVVPEHIFAYLPGILPAESSNSDQDLRQSRMRASALIREKLVGAILTPHYTVRSDIDLALVDATQLSLSQSVSWDAIRSNLLHYQVPPPDHIVLYNPLNPQEFYGWLKVSYYYDKDDRTHKVAELGVLVRDDMQGQKLGVFLNTLALYHALRQGVELIRSEIISSNHIEIHLKQKAAQAFSVNLKAERDRGTMYYQIDLTEARVPSEFSPRP